MREELFCHILCAGDLEEDEHDFDKSGKKKICDQNAVQLNV